MNKRIVSSMLILFICIAALPFQAAAASAAVASSYSSGVIKVEGTGFDSGAEYTVRIVNSAEKTLVAMGQVTANGSGAFSASVTTGTLATLTNYIVYVNSQDGLLAAQDSTITSESAGSTTDDDGTDGNSDTNTASPVASSTTGNTMTASGKVTGKTDSAGKASGTVDADTASALVSGAKAAEKTGKKAVVELMLEPDQSATAAEVTIPKDSFASLATDTDADLTVDAGIGTVTFNASAVSGINSAASAGDIKISVARVDTAALSGAEKAQVGDRPVYDFTVTSGSKTISDFGGGSANIGLPYTPSAGEDPNAIVVYYLNDSGSLETVRGKYNADTGMVEFVTNHFSKYIVGYNKIAFSDVAGTAWYHDAVTFIAARGITTGTSTGTFSPDGTLTRGQFIVLLMRAYGIEADETPSDNFSDAGSTYYTNYLASAKRLGISTGVGDNKFAPESQITRQDMFTLLYRALDSLDALPETTAGKTVSEFSDAGDIADYAQEAMKALVKGGIISGSGGKLDPAGTSTRAQMAQVLYNLLSA